MQCTPAGSTNHSVTLAPEASPALACGSFVVYGGRMPFGIFGSGRWGEHSVVCFPFKLVRVWTHHETCSA